MELVNFKLPEGKNPESLKFRVAARAKMKQIKVDFKVIMMINMNRNAKLLKIEK
jgi:hypothetical protein